MEIKVLGPGCAKCRATADLITRVSAETGRPVTVEKIEDMRQIVSFGAMTTPAVVIGGKVVHKGSVPSQDQVRSWLE
ncbi:MAG: thioredoxin family protein [Tabrizicola sp.]